MKTKTINLKLLGEPDRISVDGGEIDWYIKEAGLGKIFNKYTRIGVNQAGTEILFAKTKHIKKRLKKLMKKKSFRMMFDEKFHEHTHTDMEEQYEVFEKVCKDIQWCNKCSGYGKWMYYVNAIDILYKLKEKL